MFLISSTGIQLYSITADFLVLSTNSLYTYAVIFQIGDEPHYGILHFDRTGTGTLYHPESQPLNRESTVSKKPLLEAMANNQYKGCAGVLLGKYTALEIDSLVSVAIDILSKMALINPLRCVCHWCGQFTIEATKQLCGHTVGKTLCGAKLTDTKRPL
ncbi:hypothetical protein DL89DRAFT_257238 [Linderina pennispora]|uniref:Uncharacterized protein n=1 Tax=Linderina pennispora TaxID=61395 RepID=A0A1Y1W8T4_9FUNG|nr:uncharacterized protein DL89DRAFT_257238 [Linderina pennispora]ORX69939.1 hypothetical protein DL89DRAFT_257238 [Linderina pennispora]